MKMQSIPTLSSIDNLFTHNEKGERAGLNIEEFCQQAMDKGLMVLDEAGENYQVAGGKTMEDFAEGMNLINAYGSSQCSVRCQEFGSQRWIGRMKVFRQWVILPWLPLKLQKHYVVLLGMKT
ncbi:MAG: hypothetical protein ACLUTU_04220 [Blautia faecis]